MNEKALSNKKMFDNLKDMFDFIMERMDKFEGKLDDHADKMAEHAAILKLVVWLAGIGTVAILGYIAQYILTHS